MILDPANLGGVDNVDSVINLDGSRNHF
jgi:hypothetical protein